MAAPPSDALLTYENEVILTNRQSAIPLPYFVPDVNIAIEAPVSVVDRNAEKHKVRTQCDDFVQYLFTPDAQREFAASGFRSINKEVRELFIQPSLSLYLLVSNVHCRRVGTLRTACHKSVSFIRSRRSGHMSAPFLGASTA